MSTPSQHEPPPANDVISTDELIRRHGVKPFRSVDDLPAGDPFGSDEEYEAFLTNLLAGHVVAVTFVTVGEMTKWTLVRHWGPDRRDTLQRFLDSLVTLPYDRQVAAGWGQIQATAQLRGRPRPVNESWVAACCLARDLPLITFNIKDYIDFAEHDGLTLLQ